MSKVITKLVKGSIVTTGNSVGTVIDATTVDFYGKKMTFRKFGGHYELNHKEGDDEVIGGCLFEDEIPKGLPDNGKYTKVTKLKSSYNFEMDERELTVKFGTTKNVVYNGSLCSITDVKYNTVSLGSDFLELAALRIFDSEKEAQIYKDSLKVTGKFKVTDYARLNESYRGTEYEAEIDKIFKKESSLFQINEIYPIGGMIFFTNERVLPEEFFDKITEKEHKLYQSRLKIFNKIKESIYAEIKSKDMTIAKLQASIMARLRERSGLFAKADSLSMDNMYALVDKNIKELEKHKGLTKIKFDDNILTVETTPLFIRTCTHSNLPKKHLPLDIGTYRISIDCINSVTGVERLKSPSYVTGVHPHHGGHTMCMGTMSGVLSESLAKFDFITAVDCVIAILEDVNGSSYHDISEFINVDKI